MRQLEQPDTVSERLYRLDERVRALQESTARGAAMSLEGQARLEGAQDAVARRVVEFGTAQAVLSQWMKDWTTEVTAWRKSMDRRMSAFEMRQAVLAREQEQARGALRAAMWAFGTALTVVTSALSGVLGRLVAGVWPQGGH